MLFSSSGSSGVKIISQFFSLSFFLPEIYFCPNSTILIANVCVVHIHDILGLQVSSGKASTGGSAVLILLRSTDTGQRHQGEKASLARV